MPIAKPIRPRIWLAFARPHSLLHQIRAQQINGDAGRYTQDREENEIGPEHRYGEGSRDAEQNRRHRDEIDGQQPQPEDKIYRSPSSRRAHSDLGFRVTSWESPGISCWYSGRS
jgi:hypothetical protein